MNNKAKISYVLSVSVGTGCYRHLQISANATLYDLHKAILDAFDFDDDHAHVFFMNNRIWNEDEAYYCDFLDDVDLFSKDYKLCSFNLKKDQKFLYVFDFGDEWIFQIKVLREVAEKIDEPQIIKSKGDAPSQYGDDEEWDDKDDCEEDYSQDEFDKLIDLKNQLIEQFANSNYFGKLSEKQQDEMSFIVSAFCENMYNYHLKFPKEWTGTTLKEILLDVFPRKISADANFFDCVEPVLKLFFEFLQKIKHIQNASTLIKQLEKSAPQMSKSANDSSNWGFAKQLVMSAQESGVDLSDEGAMQNYIDECNKNLKANSILKQNNIPVHVEKIGRNEPCPCGSGKKYKKCCGA